MVEIGNYQFGFCQGRSTTGAMFILKMLRGEIKPEEKET
jgi:hypothetical protein